MVKFRRIFLSILVILSAFNAKASSKYSKKIYLWRGVPGMETQVRDTILYVCPANSEKSNSAKSANKKTPAVIICPGGSYHHLGMPHEGFATARWFNSLGITAFVLRYRVAYNDHHYPAQFQDFQMAIAHIREHAEEYNIEKEKIGAIGFSAGGHLVTMAGARTVNELEPIGIHTKESLRANFCMPIYPVVSMQDDIGHKWSRKSLIGRKPSQELKDEFSMELQIPDDMPPTFILACIDDPVVIYENSVRLDSALSAKGIPHVFVTYPRGGHGFGMKENSKIMQESHWNDKDLLPWLQEIGIVN